MIARQVGAPNLMRGGSYSGNVGALDIFSDGFLDILASDYVPRSMLEGAFKLHQECAVTLPDAIALVTDNPARAANLVDRGRIQPGCRADLVQVTLSGGHPLVKAVWCSGRRVH